MNKTYRNIFIFAVIFVLIAIIIVFSGNNQNSQNENNSLQNTSQSNENNLSTNTNIQQSDDFSNIQQPHWKHIPITYRFNDMQNCHVAEDARMREAFNIISEDTRNIVSFSEITEKADIEVYCVDLYPSYNSDVDNATCINVTFSYRKSSFSPSVDSGLDPNLYYVVQSESLKISDNETIYRVCYMNTSYYGLNKQGYYTEIAGISGPVIIGNVIENASITFFRDTDIGTGCVGRPTREIHEILHTLGFAHNIENVSGIEISNEANELKKDVMYPYLICMLQKEINYKYISCLKKIYSNGQFDGDCSTVKFLS